MGGFEENPTDGGAAFSGTQGSVTFIGADTFHTEDNDALYFDDTNEYLGVNAGTSPNSHLHVSGDPTTDTIAEIRRTAAGTTNHVLFVGAAGSTADFAVWGDGVIGINATEAQTNVQLRLQSTNATGAMVIDQNGTGSEFALLIDHEGTTGDAMDITGANTTSIGLDVACNSLTSGKAARFASSSSSAVARTILEAASTNATPASVKTLVAANAHADGIALSCERTLGTIVFQMLADGVAKWLPIADGTETDVAPSDDHTLKKLSLQKLASAPTNAAYIAFTNNPGAESFYLVLEEG